MDASCATLKNVTLVRSLTELISHSDEIKVNQHSYYNEQNFSKIKIKFWQLFFYCVC